MIYNFDALASSSDDDGSDNEAKPQADLSTEERKRAEIQRLEAIRDQKRKELLSLKKTVSEGDSEHQAQLKEMSKQVLKLSRAAEEQKQTAQVVEKKLKAVPANAPGSPAAPQKQSVSEVQSEIIRNLRIQTDSLKTDIQKAKRVLAQEGGCKNRAVQIRKLEALLEDLPKTPKEESVEVLPPKTASAQNVDVQTLRNEIGELTQENDSLKLKLKGLVSRVTTLEKNGLKENVKKRVAISEKNDVIVERLRPKQRRRQQQKKFRDHVGQQSRLAVIILGLNSELVARNKELNHGEVESNEAGICKEIERMQKRLHLLESSMSCLI